MRRRRRATMRTGWWQALARDAALVISVGVSDAAFGHLAAAFSTVVALCALLRLGIDGSFLRRGDPAGNP